MNKSKFSAFTSDLARNPEIRKQLTWSAGGQYGYEVRETVSHDGTITTFEAVMA